MSRSLPSDHHDLNQWIATELDAAQPPRVGRNWKNRVQGGKSVHAVLADTDTHRVLKCKMTAEELITIAHHQQASGLARNAWMRRAVGLYLVDYCGVPRSRVASMLGEQ